MSLRLESVSVWCLNPKLIPNFHSPHRIPSTTSFHRSTSFLAFASPRQEQHNHDHSAGPEESLKQALDTFREQASKIREASHEKAILVLKDAAEQLKQIGQEAKEYIAVVENSPEVKEIVETFTSPNREIVQVSQWRDFNVGIPYGLVLSVVGFVSFMVTGSITALRFGIVLGGVLLALSISSLRSYKRGQTSSTMLKGQTAIASILFLRETRLLAAEGSPLVTYFTALISGAVVAFYVYRLVQEHKQQNASNSDNNGAEN